MSSDRNDHRDHRDHRDRARHDQHVRGEEAHGPGSDPSVGFAEPGDRRHGTTPDDAHLARDGAHPGHGGLWLGVAVLVLVAVVVLVALLLG